jgi:hypothetical protein
MAAMSSEPESKESDDPSASRESLDLTGLPTSVADGLRKLVAALRDNLGSVPSSPSSATAEQPEAWARRLQAWVDTHPARKITIDDSRETLYSGRGE